MRFIADIAEKNSLKPMKQKILPMVSCLFLKNKHRQGTMLIMQPISVHAFQEASNDVQNAEEQCLCTMEPRSTPSKKQNTNTVMFKRCSDCYLSSLYTWQRAKRHRTQYNANNAGIRKIVEHKVVGCQQQILGVVICRKRSLKNEKKKWGW